MDRSIGVLVVDDDRAMRETLVRYLRHLGFEQVAEEANGWGALERLHTVDGIGLVLTAENMALMTGAQLIERIRETAFRPIKVVMLGTSRETDGAEGGADAFLQKPFEPDEFTTKLDELIPG